MNQEPSKPEQSDVDAVRASFENWWGESPIEEITSHDNPSAQLCYWAWKAYQAGLASRDLHHICEKSANGLEWEFANTVHDLPIGTKLYAVPPPPKD